MASVLMFLPQTPRHHCRPPQMLGTSLSPCASCCHAWPGLVLRGHIGPTASGQSEVCAWHRAADTPEPAQKAVLPWPSLGASYFPSSRQGLVSLPWSAALTPSPLALLAGWPFTTSGSWPLSWTTSLGSLLHLLLESPPRRPYKYK